jgi:2-polyprenyl-3-methyl-5-hydroxy-6-metoxy-1,4-benzoquinol methylase
VEFKLKLFKRNRKNHWNHIYQKYPSNKVGWYQAFPERSLELILKTNVGLDSRVIDVGGGTSKLTEHLLDKGYNNLSVLDISRASIETAKLQIGEKSDKINWIEADITNHSLKGQYDLWHDRAVFHFLTKKLDRNRYIDALNQALRLNGYLIIATFGLDAPSKCSGLPVVRYTSKKLQIELGDNFHLVEDLEDEHMTPSGVKQTFIFCRFIKIR